MVSINSTYQRYADKIKKKYEELAKNDLKDSNDFNELSVLINQSQNDLFQIFQSNKHIVSSDYQKYLDKFIESLDNKEETIKIRIKFCQNKCQKIIIEGQLLEKEIKILESEINNLEIIKKTIPLSGSKINKNEIEKKIKEKEKLLQQKKESKNKLTTDFKSREKDILDLENMLQNIPQRQKEYYQLQNLIDYFDYDIPLEQLGEDQEKAAIGPELHRGLPDDVEPMFSLYTPQGLPVSIKTHPTIGQYHEIDIQTTINGQPKIIKGAKITGIAIDSQTGEIDLSNIKAYDSYFKEFKEAYTFTIYPGVFFKKSLVPNTGNTNGLAALNTSNTFDQIKTEEFINFKPLTISRGKNSINSASIQAIYDAINKKNGDLIEIRAGEFFDKKFEDLIKDEILDSCTTNIGQRFLDLTDDQKTKIVKDFTKQLKTTLSKSLTAKSFHALFKQEVTKKSFVGDENTFKNHIFLQLEPNEPNTIGEKILKKAVNKEIEKNFKTIIIKEFQSYHTTFSAKDDPTKTQPVLQQITDPEFSIHGRPNTGFWSNFLKKPAATLYNKIRGIHKDYNLTHLGSNSYLTFISGTQSDFTNILREKDKTIDFTTHINIAAFDSIKASVNVDGNTYATKGATLQHAISGLLNNSEIKNNKVRAYAALNIIKSVVKNATDKFGELRILKDTSLPKSDTNPELIISLNALDQITIKEIYADNLSQKKETTHFDEKDFILTNNPLKLVEGVREALKYTNITLNNYNKRYQKGLMDRQNNRFKTEGSVVGFRQIRNRINRNDNKRDFAFSFTTSSPIGDIECSFDKGLITLKKGDKIYSTKNIEYLLKSSEFFGAQIDILKGFYSHLSKKLLTHPLIAKKSYAVKCPDTGRMYVLDRHGDIGYFIPESDQKGKLRASMPQGPLNTTNTFTGPLQRVKNILSQGANKTIQASISLKNAIVYDGEHKDCGVIKQDLQGIDHGYVLLEGKSQDQLFAKPELMGKLINVMIRQMGAPLMKPIENTIVSLEKKLTFA